MAAELLSPEAVAAKTSALGVPLASRIAVAVSGGADSLALTLLLKAHFDVVALTVDHGLREDAAAEAECVHKSLTGLGVKHHTLRWLHHGEIPKANVQAQAREARYGLMADWCESEDISYLLTAHHENDQAETLLLRLARGSGIYGLAAMEAVRAISPRVKIVRPLLDVGKDQIVAALKARNISWIEDPSNQSDAFERVKARKMLESQPLEGLTTERLAATARRLRRTREAMQFYENEWLGKAAIFYDAGYAELNKEHLKSAPVEVVLRGLTSLLRFAGGGDYGPRFEKLERLLSALLSPEFTGHTLGGVRFVRSKGNVILIVREIAAAEAPVQIQHNVFWDKRFDVSHSIDLNENEETFSFGMLGQMQLYPYNAELKQQAENTLNVDLPPAEVLRVLPAFFNTERLIAVPYLGYNPGGINLPLLTHRWLSLSKSG
ncbi:tRNA lysidine(34) synthetase TilS [Kordiimonas aquimaris]|uniref:tRNA lysidine(34) synthetase TilS n=1 Tax=Kordiimonas aquimaris TaxID=707591 RepID=UPI0021D3180A|nr:tRNA lysidine(34) synthetase TilS [Kordiimonas aquimaris]